MEQAPEKMSDSVLLDQINCFDPYDVEFAKRYRAQAARIAHLEAQVAAADALAERARFWAAHPTAEAARDLILEIQEYDAAKKDGA